MAAERAGRGGAAGAALISAASSDDAEALRALFREYADSLGEQGWLDGCVAPKRLGEEVCELKRLYVRPAARGGAWAA